MKFKYELEKEEVENLLNAINSATVPLPISRLLITIDTILRKPVNEEEIKKILNKEDEQRTD